MSRNAPFRRFGGTADRRQQIKKLAGDIRDQAHLDQILAGLETPTLRDSVRELLAPSLPFDPIDTWALRCIVCHRHGHQGDTFGGRCGEQLAIQPVDTFNNPTTDGTCPGALVLPDAEGRLKVATPDGAHA